MSAQTMQASYGHPSNRPPGMAAVAAVDRSGRGIIKKEAVTLPAAPQVRENAADTGRSEQWGQPTPQHSNKQYSSDYSRHCSRPPPPLPQPPPPPREGSGVKAATRVSRRSRGGRRGRDRSEGRGAATGPAGQDREKKEARDDSDHHQPSLESLRWPLPSQEGVVVGVKSTRSSRRRPEI